MFVGDIMPMKIAPDVHDLVSELFDTADIVLANIESPVTFRNPKKQGKGCCNSSVGDITFDMPLSYLSDLFKNCKIFPRKAILNIANNHAGDEGESGLMKTIENLESLGATVVCKFLNLLCFLIVVTID